MNKKIKILFALILIFIFTITFNTNIYANNSTNLHEETKINDILNDENNYNNYSNELPSITVLTHGLNSSDFCWSNNQSTPEVLSYNSASLLKKISNKLNADVIFYVANGNSTLNPSGSQEKYSYNFGLKKYTYQNYLSSSSGVNVSAIDDITRHIVVIYNSSIPDETNEYVYGEFEFILDNISKQYKEKAGKLPIFNLVGHSRGGVTNIMYATDHPYNVKNIVSMGTPYNGSKLGHLELMLDILNFVDSNYEITNDGVIDILSESENKIIRDKWNQAYQLTGVDINVIVYGSATSIEIAEALFDDIATNQLFSSYRQDYPEAIEILQVVIEVANEYPNFFSHLLNSIDNFAYVVDDAFEYNLYGDLFAFIDPKLENKTNYDEVNEVLQLINIINDEIVIMDDLFIDINSQFGLGFSDGIEYLGFNRRLKVFTAEDYTINRSFYDEPGIVHNLESMNDYYTDSIANLILEYEEIDTNTLNDEGTLNLYVNKYEKINFEFTPNYTASRNFQFSNSYITLHACDNNGNRTLISNAENEITYNFKKNITYIITVVSKATINRSVYFSIVDTIGVETKTILVEKNDSAILKVQSNMSGYYIINTNNSNVSITNANNYSNNKYYIYLNYANGNKYIMLHNSSSYNQNVTITIQEPTEIELNDSILINSNYKVAIFMNDKNYSQSFQLSITWTSGNKNVSIFKNDNSNISATIENSGTKSIYTFTLNSNTKCFIIYSSADSTITSSIVVNENNVKWKIDGSIIDEENKPILPRENIYSVELIYYSADGIEQPYDSTYIFTESSSIFTYSNKSLNITSTALIGYEIIITPKTIPNRMLTIIIGPEKYGVINVSNYDDVIVTFTGETPSSIKWKINNSIYESSGSYYNITSKLPSTSGTSTIVLYSITYNNLELFNGTYFNIASQSVHNLYASGTGTSSNPYQINCYRHLNNVRQNPSKYFIQTNHITMDPYSTWTPIPTFSGNYNGNIYYIHNLKITVTSSGRYFGFIGKLTGTIKKTKFANADIVTQGISSAGGDDKYYIGIICGYAFSGSTIDTCDVDSLSSIDSRLRQSYIGGVAGVNYGSIISTSVINFISHSSGYSGGITGYNGGILDNCIVSADFYYYWSVDNGYIGGITAVNNANGELIDCSVYGTYIWNSTDDSDGINPFVGGVIGYNSGIYSNCTCINDIDEWNGIVKKFLGIVTYNQEKYCFAEDDGKLGYDA